MKPYTLVQRASVLLIFVSCTLFACFCVNATRIENVRESDKVELNVTNESGGSCLLWFIWQYSAVNKEASVPYFTLTTNKVLDTKSNHNLSLEPPKLDGWIVHSGKIFLGYYGPSWYSYMIPYSVCQRDYGYYDENTRTGIRTNGYVNYEQEWIVQEKGRDGSICRLSFNIGHDTIRSLKTRYDERVTYQDPELRFLMRTF